MPPLPQDILGELGKYVTRLEQSLEKVKLDLGLVRTQIKLENVEAQLLSQLTPEEQAAIDPFMQRLNLAELNQQRDLLIVQRDALIHAIDIVRSRLG